ncbi:hypothetical protein ACIA3K_00610 [Micromonospora sp. NPDC051543]|uniref:hypothetical protein n=1 Tax=Micromonospora sp. NPDC051543 TaxID=3364287 RepID=UPI00378F0290
MVRYARAGTVAAAAVTLVAAGSSTAWAQPTAPTGTSPPRAAAMVAGVGHFVYDEPNMVGHRIWFGVAAVTTVDGSTRGEFRYRHALPDGTELARGRADVTCLRVVGNVAVFTAIVPDGVDPVRNHGYYVKIIDGGRQPDVIVDAQTQNGTEPPPTGCLDPESELPPEAPARPRYPILAGGYVVRADTARS